MLVHCNFPQHNTNLLHKDILRKGIYRKALEWRSLAHHFVLPLLGIFNDNSHLFLVSPLVTNGTVTEWRKDQKPKSEKDVEEIHRLVRFQRLPEELNGMTRTC